MDVCVFVEPQEGASYEQQLRFALAAEQLGFDGFFRSDHLLPLGGGHGLPGPTDAWVTLAGLARETRTLRLGTLVSPATFRLPGQLAIIVAQVDGMSGGRVELGLGAGWHEGEHRARGIPFPPLPERMDRLEEQLRIIRGFWSTPDGETFDFTGAHYHLEGCPPLPRPVQTPGPPLIVGGTGRNRTPRLAAAFATEINVPFVIPAEAAVQFARASTACEAVGRNPESLQRSVAVTVCCGRTPEDLARRVARTGEGEEEMRRRRSAIGSPAEVIECLCEFRAAGASRLYLQVLDLDDLEHLELLASDVLPGLR